MDILEVAAVIFILAAGIFLLIIGLILAVKIMKNQIDITKLICEKDSDKASLSRFQLLIWTFIVGFSFLFLLINSDTFPEITPEVLALLGISGGTYVVSKGIQKAKPDA